MVQTSGLTDLVLLGGGGLSRETIEAVRAVNAVTPTWQLRGILDDNPALGGGTVGGLPVLGPIDSAARGESGVRLIATVASSADPGRRRRVVDRVGADAGWASVVHPSASLAGSVRVGVGCVVLAGCVATADAVIGDHVVMMPGCVLTHDDEIGSGATLASGVRVSGGVRVGEDAYLGTGAMIREGVRIGAGAVVGMGSVVLRDVPDGEVWAGVPAVRLRPAPGR